MRRLTAVELELCRFLLQGAGEADREGELTSAQVNECNDGGMGSLLFCSDVEGRMQSATLAELTFADRDGVCVFAFLDLDQFGKLYELDIWKVDFSPLEQIPSVDKFELVRPRHSS